jgi:hypothetical protein
MNQGSWIFSPEKVTISISQDGNTFEVVKTFANDARKQNNNNEVVKFIADINNSSTRFIKIQAKNIKVCPDWHAGAGGKAWLFVDEIIVK